MVRIFMNRTGCWAARSTQFAAGPGDKVWLAVTARARSSSMSASPSDIVAGLVVASRKLEGDYRELEDRVCHLARTTRGFTRWAQNYLPGTRASSQAYGVLWLWFEVAHADKWSDLARAESWPASKFAMGLTDTQLEAPSATIGAPANAKSPVSSG